MKRPIAASHSATELKIALFRRRFVNFAKNPSTAFNHEDEVGVKWNVQLACAASHARTPSVLVRAIVVEDDMHLPARRKLLLDGVEKGDEFLLPVAAHALSDHRAVEDIEGCKQGGRAMTLVVMGACLRPSFLHGKRRLRASQRLNLRFLVHRQDHRMLGRV